MMGGKSWDTDLLLAMILVSLTGGAAAVGQFAGFMFAVAVIGAVALIGWVIVAGILAFIRDIFAPVGRPAMADKQIAPPPMELDRVYSWTGNSLPYTAERVGRDGIKP